MFADYFGCWWKKGADALASEPLPSEGWDNLIAKEKMQRSIARSRANQLRFAQFEFHLAAHYTNLIDKVIKHNYPAADSETENHHYQAVLNQLAYFIAHDITQHEAPDARQNAFRRWINIGESLAQRGNFAALVLLVNQLELVKNPQLIQGLPEGYLQRYQQLEAFASDPVKRYRHYSTKPAHSFYLPAEDRQFARSKGLPWSIRHKPVIEFTDKEQDAWTRIKSLYRGVRAFWRKGHKQSPLMNADDCFDNPRLQLLLAGEDPAPGRQLRALEAETIANYAQYLDYQLLAAFKKVNLRILRQPELLGKNAINQDVKLYHATRDQLIGWIQSDLNQRSSVKSRAHCFQRWVYVAAACQERRNFEAMVLVVSALANFSQLEMTQTEKALPLDTKSLYLQLCNQLSSGLNKKLRDRYTSEEYFPLISELFSALTHLKDSMDGEHWGLNSRNLDEGHPEFSRITTRDNIYSLLSDLQRRSLPKMAEGVKSALDSKLAAVSAELEIHQPAVKAEPQPSRLYQGHLGPAFWQRQERRQHNADLFRPAAHFV